MKPGRKKWIFVGALVALGVLAFVALRGPGGPDPCAEPPSGSATSAAAVRCAERYVLNEWYTTKWGRFGAIDSDPMGEGTWFGLVRAHRGTLKSELDAICTHPRVFGYAASRRLLPRAAVRSGSRPIALHQSRSRARAALNPFNGLGDRLEVLNDP